MSVALENELKDHVRGEVHFGKGYRAMYAADSSNYREVPLGVVVPRSIEDMARAVEICAKYGAPILHRGGGTSLAGQTVSEGSVVIDSSKYCNRIEGMDVEKRLAVVEPGTVLDDLRDAAIRHGLTFGPDPSTHNHNTLGGMIGNNSCGTHSLQARRTSDNVHALEILTYDGVRMSVGKTSEDELARLEREPGRKGDIYRGLKFIRDTYADEIRARFPQIPRRVSGYNLDELLPENGFHVGRALVGSEGTCVTVLRATVDLIPHPARYVLLVIGFDSIVNAADAVPQILPFKPIALEGMDYELTVYMRKKNFRVNDLQYLPEGHSWLLAQFGGDTVAEAEAKAAVLETAIKRNRHVTSTKILSDVEEMARLWKVREAGLGCTAWVPGLADTWEGWEDSAVAPENLGAYMRDLKALYAKFGYSGAIYGHFGDGLIHTRIDFGLHTEAEVKKFRGFIEEAGALVVRHGGSLSGEHGDGRSRAELWPIMFGPTLMTAFEQFKRVWDPLGRMNPGKLIMPKAIDTDLRYGPQFKMPQLDTVFKFPESENSFSRAVMRCVGVGECRSHKSGTMCPSYRGTREEQHSTRGRARLLQEMLEGSPVTEGWKSDDVRQSLDLCLSCKACKSECPVNVDMATYRAEFLHHYYQTKIRPLASYTMGLVHVWAPWASKMARLFNFVTQRPGFSSVAKRIGGIHPDRTLPALAEKTFRAQWRPKQKDSPVRALLWVDTFNNYFTPQPLLAAADVLQASGHDVVLSPQGLCCGRPYYDFGRLTEAKEFLARGLEVLSPLMDDRTWLVGVEASCLSVFRDELRNLFPDDDRAARLAERSITLSAFLNKFGHGAITLGSDIAIHAHCHHKAVLGVADEVALLRKSGRKVDVLDSGCCGMAGAFGYEREKYKVSQAIAEQGLLPCLAAVPQATTLAVDGFSCRHQISHFTERNTQTLPEILRDALKPV
ncbi:MAG: FAD-binding oxidoreductase [Pseudomonadota bacterium]|nr:FAD-binding oxidoreductase [Pseudomonadota bacterium]